MAPQSFRNFQSSKQIEFEFKFEFQNPERLGGKFHAQHPRSTGSRLGSRHPQDQVDCALDLGVDLVPEPGLGLVAPA